MIETGSRKIVGFTFHIESANANSAKEILSAERMNEIDKKAKEVEACYKKKIAELND